MEAAEQVAAGAVTHYVVQAYRKGKRGKIEAFSRTGDPDTGDFDEPVILAKHGDVPEHLG